MLGIPLKPEEAFETILNGTDRQIDYGLVNDSMMISTMTIGLLADTAAATSQEEKQQFGPLLLPSVFPLFYSKKTKKQYKLEIIADGKRWRGKSQLLTVSHVQFQLADFTNFDELARPDDGLLSHDFIAKTQSIGIHYLLAPDHTWSYCEKCQLSSTLLQMKLRFVAQEKNCLYTN